MESTYRIARKKLEQSGIHISDEAFRTAFDAEKEYMRRDARLHAEYPGELGPCPRVSVPEAAYNLLVFAGAGDDDYDTGEWTSWSDQVYAFEAEVFDVHSMYTLFLQGVESIVPGAHFEQVQEDLSEMTDEWKENEDPACPPTDGKRSVSFVFNGKEYQFTFASYLDWFNVEMIAQCNQLLRENGFPGQLHSIGHDSFDLTIILFYGSEQEVSALEKIIQ